MEVKMGQNEVTKVDSITVELPGSQDIKIPNLKPKLPEETSNPIQINVNDMTNIDTKTISSDKLQCKIISYDMGDEDELQDEFLNFFTTSPKMVYQTTWTVGIKTYFMFIYR